MTQEFVTLPREVAERALKSMLDARCSVYDGFEYDKAATALAAAMEQTPALDQPQNHVPDAGNMVTAGWRLVPVEPTEKMVDMGRGLSSFPNGVYRAMLSAAPQRPAQESAGKWDNSQKKKYWSKRYQQEHHARLHLEKQLKEANDMLASRNADSANPPLTDEQIKQAVRPLYHSQHQAAMSSENDIEIARVIERAHNIK